LNVELHYGAAGRGYMHQPNCFGTATAADLVMPDGAKFIGSAQLHKAGAILQHGSMRLQQDMTLFTQVFGERSHPPQLPDRFAQPDSYSVISEALISAAKDCFAAEFTIAPLSAIEREQINRYLLA
jgi:lipoate-protein ligase A